jgi:hypothetical protein
MIQSNVADVDPGSGALDPGWKKNPEPGSGIRNEHLGYIFENLISVFWIENTYNSFIRIQIRDLVSPGSGMEKIGPGILNTDPKVGTYLE